jgi:type IV secretion system protein TrbI
VIANEEDAIDAPNGEAERVGNERQLAGDGRSTDDDANAAASHAKRSASGSPAATPRSATGASLRPPFPLAKRLNRNALTVAAALAGVTVLTVIVLTKPARESAAANGPAGASGDVAPPVPARPTFLDQLPRVSPIGSRRESAAVGRNGVRRARGLERAREGEPISEMPVPPRLSQADDGVGSAAANDDVPGDDPSNSVPVAAAVTSPTGASARRQAYEAALTSAVLVAGTGPGVGSHGNGGEPGVERDDATVGAAGGQRIDTAPSAADPSGTFRPPDPIAGTSTIPARLSSVAPIAQSGVATELLDSPGPGYTLRAGTLIPGLLLTGVNSDLPGAVVGQTSRDVFDSRTEQVLLVPKGSRLIGAYDNRSAATGRLIVEWTRLILPDGRGLSLPHLPATDERGQAGLHDQVDHHYVRSYGAALLTSVLTAGVQLSQPQQSAVYAAPSSRQVAAGALGQNLGDVSLERARRGLDAPPTLTIRAGQSFNVLLSGDVAFNEPYVAAMTAMAH